MAELHFGDPLAPVIGAKTAKALESGLGLRTVEDLLRHYPRRYAERGQLSDLASLQVDEHVTVMARISKVDSKTYVDRKTNRRTDRLEVVVTDGHGSLVLTFFKQSWRAKDLREGRVGLFSGKVGVFRSQRQLAHPDYVLLPDSTELADVADESVLSYAGALIPVYPATAAMSSWKIASAVGIVLDQMPGDVDDPLPESTRISHELMGLRPALLAIHRPESRAHVTAAQQRLRWDEAFVLQTVLAQRRFAHSALQATARVAKPNGILAAFDSKLPFTLTAGQVEIGSVIFDDIAQTHPMNRLLQGEVGSGKTLVALRAMLAVVDAGGQAVLLAPTEVLAAQHFRSITNMLGPLAERGMMGGLDSGTRVALLTGSLNVARRRQALLDISVGDAGIVIGTHALLEDRVQFFDLGLAVIDEQHRFGVEQRAALTAKSRDGSRPHVLVMTATPIPRTVAMTVFGDLDVSTLSELPQGRAPITSHVVPAVERPDLLARVWTRVREEVESGHQVYVVAPRIGDGSTGSSDEDVDEPDDSSQTTSARRPPIAVLDLAPMLSDGPLAGLRVAVLHGRLPSDEKDDIMRRFAAGPSSSDGIDVLIATTVIEVGVDVPNSTVMVIMDADRFGVSQLHQLRGRVGRGGHPGLALLVSESPIGSPARERLDAVAATIDGFELSRIDLEQRREGDVLGAVQSGRKSSLRMLSVLRDEDIIDSARDEATAVVASDPELAQSPALARAVAALLDDDQADYLEKS